jgi:hypothetical protein
MNKSEYILSDFSKAFGKESALQLSDKYIWTNFNSNKYLVTRYPLSCMLEPSAEEISKVFKLLKPIFISYAVSSINESESNTYFYYTTDKEYVLEKLKGPQRRTTKKSLRSFEFKEITWDEFKDKGYKCYKDARDRNGLSDGGYDSFTKLIEASNKIPTYKILAAIDPESGKLAATLIFNHIGRLITTIGHYSENDFLINRPNNGLFHILKQHYLVTDLVEMIEYGYSSIQQSSNHESLHFFKTSIGFEALSVDRKFIINPKYRLLFNPLSKLVYKLFLKIFPQNKYLLKVDSVLN